MVLRHGVARQVQCAHYWFYSVATNAMVQWNQSRGGKLPYRQRLPASRDLARQLGVGRNLVVSVYNQLCDEGVLQSDGRRGTIVIHQASPPVDKGTQPWAVARRAKRFVCNRNRHIAFSPGQPDTSLFPRDAWRRALKVAARLPPDALTYQDSSLPLLQHAISRYPVSYTHLTLPTTPYV